MKTTQVLIILAFGLIAPLGVRADNDDDDDFDDREQAWEDYHESIEWARRHEFRRAYSEVKDALETLPHQGEFLLQKGYLLLELCHMEEAIAALKAAHAAGPERVSKLAEEELTCLGEIESKTGGPTYTRAKIAADDPKRKAEKDPHPKHYGPDAHDPHLGRWYPPHDGCCEGPWHPH